MLATQVAPLLPHDFSTGQVAKVLGCSSRKVCTMVDRGLLGSNPPLGTERRIGLEHLRALCDPDEAEVETTIVENERPKWSWVVERIRALEAPNGVHHPERPLESEPVFTTGAVASLLRFSPRVVADMVDSGRMPGYVVPGSSDRRITRRGLDRFLSTNGLPPIAAWERGIRHLRVLEAARMIERGDTFIRVALRSGKLDGFRMQFSSERAPCRRVWLHSLVRFAIQSNLRLPDGLDESANVAVIRSFGDGLGPLCHYLRNDERLDVSEYQGCMFSLGLDLAARAIHAVFLDADRGRGMSAQLSANIRALRRCFPEAWVGVASNNEQRFREISNGMRGVVFLKKPLNNPEMLYEPVRVTIGLP